MKKVGRFVSRIWVSCCLLGLTACGVAEAAEEPEVTLQAFNDLKSRVNALEGDVETLQEALAAVVAYQFTADIGNLDTTRDASNKVQAHTFTVPSIDEDGGRGSATLTGYCQLEPGDELVLTLGGTFVNQKTTVLGPSSFERVAVPPLHDVVQSEFWVYYGFENVDPEVTERSCDLDVHVYPLQ